MSLENCNLITVLFKSTQISSRNKKNQLSPEMKKESFSLAGQYNQKELFSYTLLLNSDGKILKSWERLPSEKALAFSKEISEIKANQKPLSDVDRIQKTSKTDREHYSNYRFRRFLNFGKISS